MATIINNIEQFFKQKTILSQLIIINLAVFIILRILGVIETLIISDTGFIQYIELPSSIHILIKQPWSLITYMFTHYGFLHILINMLWLYWFGKIFLTFFNPKQLGGLYILGGLGGALFFIVAYNIFPYFKNLGVDSYMLGASASVMAIVFGASFYKKNYEINLLFIGNVKIIYLAIICFIIDIFAATSVNGGGHIAHIGGALTGIVYSYFYSKGADITSGLNRAIDKISGLFGQKKKFTQAHASNNRFESDYEYNARQNQKSTEIDEILDKIKKSGYNSLTKEEKRKLFDASNK